ncbi:MAG: prepilin-type N-terminal cleavage/methylation domain-containing protein [Moorea sp. SIO4A1]|uniref:prepilin-type N-terminal cleavage/methylation domain-containing protein n=1 Tax=Moorena sp. SIO4A1 TaxID=2607835 RepID=UPI00144DA4CB|nr:prepilin-type N-terminal cleavage/methylation domain-containing protein [Moorena sp. SIO4A1]NEQ63623.1 prepilin-type N-terminal cleavage/methylation domain-containing protein [Moorena sp. SIO4A1]
MEDNQRLNRKANQDAGFTLLELIVVILLVGILSAIAAPSWLAFVNRQRVSKVNERVLSVIQEAQRQAKNKKFNYSVSFRMNDGVPEAAVYQNNKEEDNTPDTFQWQSLVGDLGVKPEQVWVGTNLTGNNQSGATLSILKEERKITFDNQGVLKNAQIDSEEFGLAIVVAVPNSKDKDNPIEATQRCVKIKTILGALETDRKGGCPSST